MLEAGWAAAEWAFGPACAAQPRRHVFARRGRGKANWQHARLIGQDAMVPWWAVARWSCSDCESTCAPTRSSRKVSALHMLEEMMQFVIMRME